jgi:hypothetical protein
LKPLRGFNVVERRSSSKKPGSARLFAFGCPGQLTEDRRSRILDQEVFALHVIPRERALAAASANGG